MDKDEKLTVIMKKLCQIYYINVEVKKLLEEIKCQQ